MKTLFLLIMAALVASLGALTSEGVSSAVSFDTVDPSLSLTQPVGGETFYIGYQGDILWQASDSHLPASPQGCIDLWASYDGGGSFAAIASDIANSGSYAWAIPENPTTQGRVKIEVTDTFGNSANTMSSADFTIQYTPPPEVTNITVAQRTDGSKIIDIHYDLADANNDPCEISVAVSDDNGATFAITPTSTLLSGDIGPDIMPGTGKHIVWQAGSEEEDYDGDQYIVKVTADDGTNPPAPGELLYVAGGSFNNGYGIVELSDFYLGKYEVTQAQYAEIMGENPSSGYGVGDDYPAYSLSWYDAIEYCNRRSIAEGLTPCYSYSSYGYDPDDWPSGWKSSDSNHTNVHCDWPSEGYRLPTESEWWFAARGGNDYQGYQYSGSNTLSEVGWYQDNSGYLTHGKGGLQSNELGTYDMSGNVYELVWDISGGTPPTGNNPHGPTSGTYRVRRGGGFTSYAYQCTTYARFAVTPTTTDGAIGFRICRITNESKGAIPLNKSKEENRL